MFNEVWSLEVSSKVRIFAWRLTLEALATQAKEHWQRMPHARSVEWRMKLGTMQ
jgi:hypothetical protein